MSPVTLIVFIALVLLGLPVLIGGVLLLRRRSAPEDTGTGLKPKSDVITSESLKRWLVILLYILLVGSTLSLLYGVSSYSPTAHHETRGFIMFFCIVPSLFVAVPSAIALLVVEVARRRK